jgi:hypothetical protein
VQTRLKAWRGLEYDGDPRLKLWLGRTTMIHG